MLYELTEVTQHKHGYVYKFVKISSSEYSLQGQPEVYIYSGKVNYDYVIGIHYALSLTLYQGAKP